MPDAIAVWQIDIKALQNISAIKLKFGIILDLLVMKRKPRKRLAKCGIIKAQIIEI